MYPYAGQLKSVRAHTHIGHLYWAKLRVYPYAGQLKSARAHTHIGRLCWAKLRVYPYAGQLKSQYELVQSSWLSKINTTKNNIVIIPRKQVHHPHDILHRPKGDGILIATETTNLSFEMIFGIILPLQKAFNHEHQVILQVLRLGFCNQNLE